MVFRKIYLILKFKDILSNKNNKLKNLKRKMRLDPLIKKRFEELEIKIKKVETETFKNSFDIVNYKAENVHEWATSVLNILERTFGKNSEVFENFKNHYKEENKGTAGWKNKFCNLKAIFLAAKEDYFGGYLFNISSLVKAEVLDDVLEQAEECINKNYKDLSAILCRVSLETLLRELCSKNLIVISDKEKLDKMNTDLSNANVYNKVKQKQITAWAGIGNSAAHGKFEEYTKNDVENFLSGLKDFTANYL